MGAWFRLTAHLAIAAAVFIAAKITISYVALSSFATLYIDAEFDHDDIVSIYFSSSDKAGFKEKFRKKSQPFVKDSRATRKILLNSHVARKLRVDTGSEAGVIKIYSIRLKSYFGPGAVFDHRQIHRNFLPNGFITTFDLKNDPVLIVANGFDPYLTLNGELVQKNFFLELVLPLILSVAALLLSSGDSAKSVHAFTDIKVKKSSSGINIGSLDGIRGLAALLVLAQHSGLTKTGGIWGVWLFFSLSGFLLAGPFVRQPSLAASRSYMTSYLARRMKRIVPMYYVMITMTILFAGKIDAAIRHYLFLQADGHFWSITQEMFFYLILPFVMAGSYLFCRNSRPLHISFIALCAYLAHHYLTIDLIRLFGENSALKPMAGVFLVGVCISFVYHVLAHRFGGLLKRRPVMLLCSLAGLSILVACLYMSAHPIADLKHFNPYKRPDIFAPAAGLFILATLLSGNSILDKLMNFLPLKAVGVVGYSFYLLHPKIIGCIRTATNDFSSYYPTGISLFVLAGIGTYLVSIFTYSYIERPFIKK